MSDPGAVPTGSVGARGEADDVDDPVLTFDDGIPGFPEATRFMLSELSEGGAFQLFTSVDNPDVSMVVAVPWLFFPDYSPDIPDLDARELGLVDPADAVVFCAVTLEPDDEPSESPNEAPGAVYVNLLGPFVVNARTRHGRQVVLDDATLPVRARVDLGA